MDLVFALILLTVSMSCRADRPNIVFIFADDMGWNDVSFHGSDQVLTPNIDMLAYSGVALGRYYTHPSCSPSRSAFLTGKYAHKTGMQGYPILMSEDRGIPINETLLPEYLKRAGYATHLVGKWHVGCSRNEYLPTSRGFDSHFGHRGGYLDYYEYTQEEEFSPVGHVSGLSLYKNLTPAWDVEGYITDVYNSHAISIIEKHDTSKPLFLMVGHNAPHASMMGSPLEAAPELVRQFRHIELTSRRMFAAMVKKLDDSVGDIVKALSDKAILNNTIIVFVSDNGGMTSGRFQNFGSNYPLRGTKMSPFEGGVRVVGLLWSTSLHNTRHYWDGYMHVSDWMPTLFSAAGLHIPSNIDGVNQWVNINANVPSSRTSIYEIDDFEGNSFVISNQYKLVTGNVSRSQSTHQGADLRGIIGKPPSYTEALLKSTVHNVLGSLGQPFNIVDSTRVRSNMVIECKEQITTCWPDAKNVCLYNIIEDPCETTDLSKSNPQLVASLKKMVKEEASRRIPRIKPVFRDPLSAPSRHNYTWSPWLPNHHS